MLFLGLILIQLVVFAVLVAFLRVILSKNITKATSHLNEINQDYTFKLEEARQKVKEAEKNYDETMLKGKSEAEKLKVQILKEAKQSQEQMLTEARRQSTDIVDSATKAKETLLAEMEEKIQSKATHKACEILGEILPELITKDMHARWVEELLKNGLEELGRLNIPEEVKEAKVTSAFALSAAEKSALQKKISQKLGRSVELAEEVTPGLVAGLRMTLGSIVIDGSLQFKIDEISRHVRR